MADHPPMLLHVGYPKTATTWLQRDVFGGDPGFDVPWPTGDNRILTEVCWTPHTAFSAERVRDAFFDDCGEAGVPVLSHEVLVGDPMRNYFWGEAAALRLKETFPNARVLITIREQAKLAYASWNEYVRRGGTFSLKSYLTRGGVVEPGIRPLMPIEYLRFSDLASLYVELFGEANVLVLPQEMMVQDQAAFLDTLYLFARVAEQQPGQGEPVYTSLPVPVLELQRNINRFVPFDASSRKVRKPINQMLRQAARSCPKGWADSAKRKGLSYTGSVVHDQVRESNAQLARMVPWSLSDYGYALPG